MVDSSGSSGGQDELVDDYKHARNDAGPKMVMRFAPTIDQAAQKHARESWGVSREDLGQEMRRAIVNHEHPELLNGHIPLFIDRLGAALTANELRPLGPLPSPLGDPGSGAVARPAPASRRSGYPLWIRVWVDRVMQGLPRYLRCYCR